MYTSGHKETTAMTEQWKMPRPAQGDVVLFSNDAANFTAPCIAWVMKSPGDSTVQLLTFTEMQGFVVKPSVHHRDDPGLRDENGWLGLGVWDFTDSAKAARDDREFKSRRMELNRGREQIASK
jgi:hypothetical protein